MKLEVSAAAALFGSLALLAACSHDPARLAQPSDMGLHFNETAGVATLAYGRANSDTVGLMLQCEAGSRRVAVSDVARSASSRSLTLVSGKVRTELAATVDAAMGQPTLWATAAMDAPALRRFRDTGRIAVSTRGGGYSLAATASEHEGVERFFRTCGRA